MQIPPRHSVFGMQTGTEDPEPCSVGILHPVVVADLVGLWSLAGRLALPPFGGDPFGPCCRPNAMRHAAPTEPDRRIVRYRRNHFDLFWPAQQTDRPRCR